MKKITLLFSCAFLISNLISAQNSSTPDMQMMMQNMMPGPVQKQMAANAGEWSAEMTMYMDPTQPPQKQYAKVHNEMVMDRYFTSTYRGTMMGMPFEGVATMAYDNGTKKYYMTWMDNMSTGMTQLSGTYDEATKTTTLTGISQDPMTGKESKMRQTITYVDSSKVMMVMYGEGPGGIEMKMMEITLTRQ